MLRNQWRRQVLVRGEEGRETTRKSLKGNTQKYCQIHAINSDRAIEEHRRRNRGGASLLEGGASVLFVPPTPHPTFRPF